MITSRGSFRATVEAEHRDGEGNLIAKSVIWLQSQSAYKRLRHRNVSG